MSEISNKNCLKFNEMSKEELINDIENANVKLVDKTRENEKYEQEIYELKHKLKAAIGTHKDLADSNESLEESMARQRIEWEKKMNNLLEKLTGQKKSYENEVLELQNGLAEADKKNEELKEALAGRDRLLATLKKAEPDKSQETFALKERINDLLYDLEERDRTEKELLARQMQMEEAIAQLERNYNQTKEILEVKKEDLRSVNGTLETTRDELVLCRSELEALKAIPASVTKKGNSLFAEVEDNRQRMMNDMNSLKKKYLHMKQTYGEKENEILVLKFEKAALLKKWEGDNIFAVDQSARLMEMYKSRIAELESRLKTEEKKVKAAEKDGAQAIDGSFRYLQTLLAAKKKEIEELCSKLEESSMQKILLEERKFDVEKQLRHWEYKAMSYQAQLIAAQGQPKCEECSKTSPAGCGGDLPDLEQLVIESTMSTTTPPNVPEIISLETTLEKLLQVPRLSTDDEEKRATIKDLDTSEGTISDQSNAASSSEANGAGLKSTLAKSEEKSSLLKTEEKNKKSLRFTPDTEDGEKRKLTRQKLERKPYPVVFISNKGERK